MTSKFQRLWEEEKTKRAMLERAIAHGGDRKIVVTAMRVINANGLAQAFVDELLKPTEPVQE